MTTSFPSSFDDCVARDRDDPLAERRDLFALPDGLLYLDGHSLGPATHKALARLEQAAKDEWAQGLIRSWNDAGWIDLARDTGARIARLISAGPDEVLVCDSVSTNLFKLAAAARDLSASPTLIIEEDEFPTDQYIAEGLAQLAKCDLLRVRPGEGLQRLAETGGILIRSAVNYRTAAVADMEEAEKVADLSGGVIVWDLSHATGVLALDMSIARLAAGCTYKYLNGGPGAPAFLYVRQDVANRITSPLPGWMGHKNPFDFASHYEPADGVARFANGTPPILSLSALAAALDAFEGVTPVELEAKARALGDFCLSLAEKIGLQSSSPAKGARRGGHVTLHHENGYAIIQALIARGIIGDFRSPDAMRLGFSPLYTGFADVWRAMESLGEVLKTGEWDSPAFRARAKVT